jgi:hypothetical protein
MALRYWVGGTGTWNSSTANWSDSSGGASGFSVPGAADYVFFDSNSGSGTITWDAGTSPTVELISANGFTGTFATAGANKTLTGTAGFVYNVPNTCTLTGAPTITVNSTGAGSILINSAHTSPSASNAPNFNFTGGTYDLGFLGTSYRDLNFTGSSVTTSSAVTMYGSLTLSTGGTFTSFEPTFLATATITSAGKTIGSTTVNGSGITVTLADALTLGITNTFTITAGTLNLAGFNLSTGIFSSSNSNTRAITFGSGNIALTSTVAATTVLSMATATGFTFTGTGAFTRNMAATATVVFGTTSGSTSNAPNLTVNAGASALTITSGSYFKNVDFTGSTCTVTATYNACGNLTLATGGTYTSIAPTFLASGTLTNLGKTISALTVNAPSGTVTLGDAATVTLTITLTAGTFTASNYSVTAASFSSNNSNTRILNMGSSTWTITGSGTTAWNTATTTGFTVNPSTSTISMTSSSAKTFAGGGLTYYTISQGGAGALTVSGSNTFTTISNAVQPTTFTFTSGTTQTVTNFNVSGTSGNLVTIGATTTSAATLSKPTGTINSNYLSISYSTATGGASWYAGANSTNGGNNTGWTFTAVPSTSGSFLFLFN